MYPSFELGWLFLHLLLGDESVSQGVTAALA
jgi:hypothetical protein